MGMKGWMRLTLLMIFCVFVSLSGSALESRADSEQKAEKKSSISENAGSVEGDVITIDNGDYKKDRKGPVQFTHREHALVHKVSCWDCHHDFKEGGEENIWSPWGEIKMCVDCHDPLKKQDKVANLQKAYHFNCKGCHLTLEKQDKKAGPSKKCAGCHEKIKKQP
ncbi:MAG: cytochrome c3 family protein [Pseudomonadota bacterium]